MVSSVHTVSVKRLHNRGSRVAATLLPVSVLVWKLAARSVTCTLAIT